MMNSIRTAFVVQNDEKPGFGICFYRMHPKRRRGFEPEFTAIPAEMPYGNK